MSNAYAGPTLVFDYPLNAGTSIYGEGGYGVTSRSGFQIDGKTALQPAHYAAGLVGGGFAFHATANTDFMLGATYSPGRQSFQQPSTRLFTAGLRYHMRPLPAADVADNRDAGFLFPENVIRIGGSTNVFGYGLNDLFSKKIPIFWGGHVETKAGLTIDYQRNVFHTKKIFAFDLGVINRTTIDGLDTGARFTFQDFMGIGAYLRKDRRMNAEIGLKHFSNGNLFVTNASIKVPLTLTVGLTF